MLPHKRFEYDPDALEMREVVVHPYQYFAWWLADNFAAVIHWMLRAELLDSPYFRYERKTRTWNINHKLTFRWNLRSHLGRA